jgi:hypothetical protein
MDDIPEPLRDAVLDEAPPGVAVVDGGEMVTAAELCDWLGETVEGIEAFAAMGVLKRGEAGLFPLGKRPSGHQVLAGRRLRRAAARRSLKVYTVRMTDHFDPRIGAGLCAGFFL